MCLRIAVVAQVIAVCHVVAILNPHNGRTKAVTSQGIVRRVQPARQLQRYTATALFADNQLEEEDSEKFEFPYPMEESPNGEHKQQEQNSDNVKVEPMMMSLMQPGGAVRKLKYVTGSGYHNGRHFYNAVVHNPAKISQTDEAVAAAAAESVAPPAPPVPAPPAVSPVTATVYNARAPVYARHRTGLGPLPITAKYFLP